MADMNCDGSVNGFEVQPFELAVSRCERARTFQLQLLPLCERGRQSL